MVDHGGTVARGGVELLAEHLLVETGPVDHAAWNYRPILGWLQRQRFRLVLELIGSQHFGNLLEIGYGSGLFAPELARHCDRYSGIDIHEKNRDVEQALRSVGIAADLSAGSASTMALADNSIDCMVAVSVFEFIDDLDSACEAMVRALRPNGRAFITATGDSPVLDLGLKLMTGESADDDFADRRARVETAIREHFVIDTIVGFPRFSVLGVQVYRAFGLRVRP